ncbi:MAG: polysaccharide biosynthesis tyrosine autokinase [Microcoleaceae cyanobacterium]
MKTGKFSQLSAVNSNTKPIPVSPTTPLNSTVIYHSEPNLFEEKPSKTNRFFKAMNRRALLVIGATTLTLTGAYLWTNHQTPKYKGSFQLFIETDNNLNADSINSVTNNQNELNYASQVKLLQSPKLLSPIIEKIQARYPEVTYSSLFNQTTGQTQFEPNKLTIQPIDGTKIIEVKYRDTEPQKIQFILDEIAQGYLNYNLQQKQPDTIAEKREWINTQLPPLNDKIQTTQQQLLNLQQQHTFINPETKNQQLVTRLNQLQTEKLSTESQLRQEQSQYQALQQQLGLTPEQALKASALSQSPRYQGLLEKLLAVETEIALESSRFKQQAPQIQVLLDQRNLILPLLTEEAEQIVGQDLAAVAPEILNYQDSVRLDLIRQLVTSANTIQMLEVRNQVLAAAVQNLTPQVQAFPAVASQFNTLQQELKESKTRVQQLTEQQESLQFEKPPEFQPWQLIAEPMIPRNKQGELIAFSPNMPLNLALGGLAGLALGVSAAQVAERLNNVFHDSREVTSELPMPLLGIIPASDEALLLPLPASAPALALVKDPTAPCTPFEEAFRSLNTNLQLLNPDSPVRSCVVSSATPADGKSTVAFNLAKGAAAMGQKVLLIDADLRNPKLHKMMGLPNEMGLTQALTQEDLDIYETILVSPVDDNLFVLTAGAIPPDPTRLLSSKKMKKLMAEFEQNFDLVLYDTPPLIGLADANLLAAHTNGLMMVVGVEKTERQAVEFAWREIQMAGVPVLGMVANGDKQPSHYYAYS